jgi:hypothetical protein
MERATGRASGGTDRRWRAAGAAALQMRVLGSVVGVDGRAGPDVALMMIASKLKLPVIGKG